MQVSGRVIILGAFGLALAMSGGAWWYHYTQVRQSAAYWGSPGGRLLVRGPEVTFIELGEPAEGAAGGETIAGRRLVRSLDLSAKAGLVHLRHALYQDSNFRWAERRREQFEAARDWAYALRFAEDGEAMVAVFPRDFSRVGRIDGTEIDAVSSPRISNSVTRYLTDIGAIESKASEVATPQSD